MKTNVVYSMILALAVVAATGCKHKPVGVTPIPGEPGPNVQEPGSGGTMNNGGGINMSGGPVSGGPAPIAEGDNWDPSSYAPDRDALAADTIHFAFDSATIRDSEQSSLQAVASALQSDQSTKLMIEGNCDERGTEEYNRSLGERRALAAREALAKLGVDPMRIRTISYGKDKPVDPGHDDAAFAKNRRDDFVLLHPKAGM